MLPYRLRPPVYGGKLKERKKQEATNNNSNTNNSNNSTNKEPLSTIDPLYGGGPVQQAIEHDLLQLRTKFLNLLQEDEEASNDVTTTIVDDTLHGGVAGQRPPPHRAICHAKRGQAFTLFKIVFGEAKIALLHSRTIPPRCERDAYSQLIYAACLSLIKNSFEASTTTNFCLKHAVFGLFCLYTLYCTNPLPTGPSYNKNNTETITTSHNIRNQQNVRREMFAMLPMGLMSLENPKGLYRRAFRNFIRIDRYHYSLLLRLVEECHARQAKCQAQSFTSMQQELGENCVGRFRCCCVVAGDAIEIVARVMTTLDLVEYTGPCGVEGMVGHADYPLSSLSNKPRVDATSLDTQDDSPVLTMDEIHNIGASSTVPFQLNENLLSTMSEYRDKIQAIRLPPLKSSMTTSESRLRSSMAPMFDDARPSWAQLYGHLSQRNAKTLFSATLNGNDDIANIQQNIDSVQNAAVEGQVVANNMEQMENSAVPDLRNHLNDHETLINMNSGEARPDYDVVLPEGLLAATQTGIENAIKSILIRNPNAWQRNETNTRFASIPSPTPFLRQDDELSTHDDTISGVSEATGPGQLGLRNLLAAVSTFGASQPNTTVFPLQPSDHFLFGNLENDDNDQMAPMPMFRNNDDDYYGQSGASDQLEDATVGDDDSSDYSDISVAVSTVGRSALRALLSAVSQNPSSNRKAQRKTAPRSKKRTRASSASKTRKHLSRNKSTTSDVEDAPPASRELGKVALDDLLSRVAENNSGFTGGKL